MRFFSLPSLRMLKKVALFLVASIFVLAVIAFFSLPAILKAVTAKQLTKLLHREVVVQKFDFNLLTLRARVEGFTVKDRNGGPFLAFEGLSFDVQAASIVEGGPIIEDIVLKAPHLNIVRNEDLTYNFSDLLEEFTKKPPEGTELLPAGRPLPFSLNNIRLEGGSLDFDDKPKRTRHEIRDLKIAIPFLSNLPYYANVSVEPAFSVNVNGAQIELKANSKPFSDTRETSINIAINDTDIARYVEYLPIALPVKIPTGNLELQAVVSFAQAKEQPPTVTVSGRISLNRWSIVDPQDRPLLQFSALDVGIDNADVFSRKFALQSIHVQSPDIVLRRTKNGEFELFQLIAEKAKNLPEATPPTAATPVKNDISASSESLVAPVPLSFNVAEVRCSDGKITYLDESVERSFQTVLDAVQIVARSVSNLPAQPVTVEVSLRSEAGETIFGDSELFLDPLKASGKFDLKNLNTKKYAPYYRKFVVFEIEEGTLDLSGQYSYVADERGGAALLSGLNTTLSAVRLRKRGEKADFVKIPVLSVKNASVDVEKKTIAIEAVYTQAGEVRVRREHDGSVNFAKLTPVLTSTPTKRKNARILTPLRKRSESSSPWLVTLKKLTVEKYAVQVEDQAPAQPVISTVNPFSLTVEDFSTKKGAKFKTTLHMSVDKTGGLNVKGPVSVDPLSANLKVEAKTINLLPFQPYFTENVNISLTSGAVSADGNLSLQAASSGATKIEFVGQAAVTKLASVTKANAENFLKWNSLYVSGIDVGTVPLRVDVKEVAVADFYSRMIVNPDATLNVQDIVRSEPQPERKNTASSSEPGSSSTVTSASNSSTAQPGGPNLIRIGKVTLQGGTIDFSDRYIKPNYSARLTQMTGRVSEMSSVVSSPADVDLRGKLDDAAPLEITGKINPFAQNLYVDLAVDFKDIDLNPMTPYIGKYAGYTVEKGKLSLGLKYLIADRTLQAQNRIFLDQFTFGEETNSPEATKLPVRLAISLLKDRTGAIKLDLPVNGSLDDPQFSVWGVLLQMVTNLVAKAATAPFALLGAMLDGGGEELSRLEFEPGRATFDSRTEEQLQKIITLLAERPAFRLDISGYVDPENDPEGLRHYLFERKLKAQKLNETVEKGTERTALDEVTIEEKEYSTHLALAYKQETFPKPRNIIGLAKGLPDEEMEKLILTHIEVTDEVLRDLAKRRAQLVREYLLQSGQLGSERVFLVEPKSITQKPEGGGKGSRVDFAIR